MLNPFSPLKNSCDAGTGVWHNRACNTLLPNGNTSLTPAVSTNTLPLHLYSLRKRFSSSCAELPSKALHLHVQVVLVVMVVHLKIGTHARSPSCRADSLPRSREMVLRLPFGNI